MSSHVVATIAALFVAFTAGAYSVSAGAFTPRTGHWFNSNESGSGYNIDIQDGTLVVTIFSYKTTGDSEWYISSGPMAAGQSIFTGTLLAVRGGQCISCTYVAPSSTISSGSITINFTSETSATVSLPGGRVTSIQPFNFGFGTPPQGLLGEWVYVENIGGANFADRYYFTTLGGATTNGNGIAADLTHHAACELQVIGSLAGYVICGHWSDSTYTVVLDQYQYRFGLDQTYGGMWISPTTFNQYQMKGYMSISASGFTKLSAPISASLDLSQNESKRQAEQSFMTEAVQRTATGQSSDFAAAIAAVVAEQRRLLANAQ